MLIEDVDGFLFSKKPLSYDKYVMPSAQYCIWQTN